MWGPRPWAGSAGPARLGGGPDDHHDATTARIASFRLFIGNSSNHHDGCVLRRYARTGLGIAGVADVVPFAGSPSEAQDHRHHQDRGRCGNMLAWRSRWPRCSIFSRRLSLTSLSCRWAVRIFSSMSRRFWTKVLPRPLAPPPWRTPPTAAARCCTPDSAFSLATSSRSPSRLGLDLVDHDKGPSEVAAGADRDQVAGPAKVVYRIHEQGAVVADHHVAEEGALVAISFEMKSTSLNTTTARRLGLVRPVIRLLTFLVYWVIGVLLVRLDLDPVDTRREPACHHIPHRDRPVPS